MNAYHANIHILRQFLANHPRLVVITGAGISASSGIPTYRDRDGVWQHSAPITHQEFSADPAKRRRYWARSLLGWPAVRDARPNGAHLGLARLEQMGHVELLITQNVDRLHQRAGSANVVDLHGRLDRVRCTACATAVDREQVQQQLLRHNPLPAGVEGRRRPDGDTDTADEGLSGFVTPACSHCGGIMMPDVVFFGGTVPAERVRTCNDALARADGVLAVGSSLQVYSGFRFCRLARQQGKPLAIINPGTTRADPLASLKLLAECEPLLAAVAANPGAGVRTRPRESRHPLAVVPAVPAPGGYGDQ